MKTNKKFIFLMLSLILLVSLVFIIIYPELRNVNELAAAVIVNMLIAGTTQFSALFFFNPLS